MSLLRKRVANRNQQDLLEFIDQLIPAHEISEDRIDSGGRSTFHWSEFFDAYDENFLRNVYLSVLRREPDTFGMTTGLQALRVEKRSRIELLGRIRYSDEGRQHGCEIEGLWIRYLLARVQRVVFLGAGVSVLSNLGSLFRPDVKHETLNVKIDQQVESIVAAEQGMSARLAEVGDRLDEGMHESRAQDADDTVGNEHIKIIIPTLKQFLGLKTTDFVVTSYHMVLGRLPQALELNTALSKLGEGLESKTMMLGKLCGSEEARMYRKDIKGLRAAYAMERLFALPIVGFFLQLPRAVRFLARADTAMEFQRRECQIQVDRLESRLMTRYNDNVKHLKLKLVELVKADSKE